MAAPSRRGTSGRRSVEREVAGWRSGTFPCERLAEIDAVPSIASVGDCDNALSETVNGLYKTELIRAGPARERGARIEDVELATLGWVHWHNTQRLHGYLNDTSVGCSAW